MFTLSPEKKNHNFAVWNFVDDDKNVYINSAARTMPVTGKQEQNFTKFSRKILFY